jgi:hypothetical protein
VKRLKIKEKRLNVIVQHGRGVGVMQEWGRRSDLKGLGNL